MRKYRRLSGLMAAALLPITAMANPGLSGALLESEALALPLTEAETLSDEEMHDLRGGLRNNRLSLGLSFEEYTVINDELVAHRASGVDGFRGVSIRSNFDTFFDGLNEADFDAVPETDPRVVTDGLTVMIQNDLDSQEIAHTRVFHVELDNVRELRNFPLIRSVSDGLVRAIPSL
jgi:hypothetical protein